MRTPLISIIMSCYNGEKYISRSVNSILNQTYKNWELIFWDNNSNDSSKKLILSFKDDRIKYFKSNKTTLLSVSRENAIKQSTGSLIAFLDVDDEWLEKKLENAIRYFEYNKDCSLYFSNYFINFSKKKKLKKTNNKFNYKKDLYNYVFSKYVLNSGLFAFLTVIIKRNVLENEKYYFDNNLHIAADFELILRLSSKHKFCFDKIPSAVYHKHGSNETSNSLEKQSKELLYCYNKISEDKRLSIPIKKYFNDSIKYNFIKVDLANKNYKKIFSKFLKIQFMSLKIKLIIFFFLSLIGINKI